MVKIPVNNQSDILFMMPAWPDASLASTKQGISLDPGGMQAMAEVLRPTR